MEDIQGEVTREMIEAGVAVLDELGESVTATGLVQAVYLAMHRLRPLGPPET